jgi:hypothetical protein
MFLHLPVCLLLACAITFLGLGSTVCNNALRCIFLVLFAIVMPVGDERNRAVVELTRGAAHVLSINNNST